MKFLLGEPLMTLGRRSRDPETVISRRIIKFWSNFAKGRIQYN